MISQLMKSDLLFFSESGVLDNAQWYRSGSFPTAQRLRVSGAAQHQEAKQEYSKETQNVFILMAMKVWWQITRNWGRIWIITPGKLLFQEQVLEHTDSWGNPVTLEQLKNQNFPAPSHSSAFQLLGMMPWAKPHSLAPGTGALSMAGWEQRQEQLLNFLLPSIPADNEIQKHHSGTQLFQTSRYLLLTLNWDIS